MGAAQAAGEPAATGRPQVLALLSYLGILCFIPLLFGQRSPFVQFHARQGLVIWAWGVLALMSLAIPGLGPWFCHFSVHLIVLLSAVGVVAAVITVLVLAVLILAIWVLAHSPGPIE